MYIFPCNALKNEYFNEYMQKIFILSSLFFSFSDNWLIPLSHASNHFIHAYILATKNSYRIEKSFPKFHSCYFALI